MRAVTGDLITNLLVKVNLNKYIMLLDQKKYFITIKFLYMNNYNVLKRQSHPIQEYTRVYIYKYIYTQIHTCI